MRPRAPKTSKLRPSGDAFDAPECSDVVTMLSRREVPSDHHVAGCGRRLKTVPSAPVEK